MGYAQDGRLLVEAHQEVSAARGAARARAAAFSPIYNVAHQRARAQLTYVGTDRCDASGTEVDHFPRVPVLRIAHASVLLWWCIGKYAVGGVGCAGCPEARP